MTCKLDEYLADWLVTRGATVRPRTLEQYAAAARVISAALGQRQLEDLTPVACASVYAPAVAAGHYRTAQIQYAVLSMALADAVRMHLLSSSPMAALRRPSYDAGEIQPYTRDECAALLADEAHGIVWRLLLETGLRRGEACALRWSDVDLTMETVSVARQAVRCRGRLIVEPPKSTAGIRCVPISADLAAALREHLREQVRAGRRGDAVISADGAAVDPRTLSRWLTRAAKRRGVHGARLHRWRHTYGADAVSAGVDIRVLQRLLGHSNISVTARYYAYVRSDVLRDAARRISAYQRSAG